VEAGTGVAVAGVGITKHGFFPALSWRDLVVDAAFQALEDAGVQPDEVDGGFVAITAPETIEQQNLGPIVADELGITPTPMTQLVAACAGGLIAIKSGVDMIAAGRARRVLVVGLEKISDAMATAETMMAYPDQDLEAGPGFDFVDMTALMYQWYMERYGQSREAIAHFALQDRWYAQRNPNAIDYGRPDLTLAEVLSAPMASFPITGAEIAKACDGASAVLLVPQSEARADRGGVEVAGIAQATGPNVLASKFKFPGYGAYDIAEALPTDHAAADAYRQAGITPDQVDVAEVHDCFDFMGILQLEGLGIFPRGRGADAVAAGETALDGRCPTCTDGGRLSLGHPTGATGINVVVEAVLQLRGAAGQRQAPRARVAVCQSMGGNNATSGVAVLRQL
jgi:acetyl-CoA C-acetyltransferase